MMIEVKFYAVNNNDAWLMCSDDNPEGCFVKYDDYAALKAERDALAAENAALQSVIEAVRGVADNSEGIAGWHRNGDVAGWDEILPEIEDIETPATDAFANQLRAEGVEMLANRLQQFIDEGDFVGSEVGLISGAIDCGKDIAAQLRAQGGE